MSRKIWGITLTISALVIILTVSLWYLWQDLSVPPKEQSGTEFVEMMPTESRPDKTEGRPVQQQAALEEETDLENDMENYQFKLVKDGNYVTVYQVPENELYEYTDVSLDILPADLQEEIRQGKYLKNEEELYNFLENYTS